VRLDHLLLGSDPRPRRELRVEVGQLRLRSNRRAEPRRCSGPPALVVPVRGRRRGGEGNREEYRGARSGPSGRSHTALAPWASGGKADQWQWESAENTAASGHPARQVTRRPARSVAPLLQGSRNTAPRRRRPHGGQPRPVPRAPRGAHPAGAFSSVGESARLITVRSLVRIQKGPRPRSSRRAEMVSAITRQTGGCSSAGRAPALQAGGRRFEPAHLQGDTHTPRPGAARETPEPSHHE
jgi:hypothetical protein